ncbi:hypothetical protein [Glycomyces sp. NPDC048151]|uniref:hypothetical protein n=1 Tax=Glycomyces sp. NPDC048151 TaxID=3364002 RepID=UPI0037174153
MHSPKAEAETARPVTPTGEETRLGGWGGKLFAFTVYEVEDAEGEPEYRVYVDDGPGERLVCWFTSDREAAPVWRGAWNGDQWCARIEERARAIVANPEAAGGNGK